jgi:hypothetical protein
MPEFLHPIINAGRGPITSAIAPVTADESTFRHLIRRPRIDGHLCTVGRASSGPLAGPVVTSGRSPKPGSGPMLTTGGTHGRDQHRSVPSLAASDCLHPCVCRRRRRVRGRGPVCGTWTFHYRRLAGSDNHAVLHGHAAVAGHPLACALGDGDRRPHASSDGDRRSDAASDRRAASDSEADRQANSPSSADARANRQADGHPDSTAGGEPTRS